MATSYSTQGPGILPVNQQNKSLFSGLSLNTSGQATINGTAQPGSTMVNNQAIGAPSVKNFGGVGGANLQTGYGIIPSSQATPIPPANMTPAQQTAWNNATALIPKTTGTGPVASGTQYAGMLGNTGGSSTSGIIPGSMTPAQATASIQQNNPNYVAPAGQNVVPAVPATPANPTNPTIPTNLTNPTAPTSSTTPPQYSSTNPPTVGSTSSQLANILNSPSPQVLSAQQAITDLQNEYAQKGVNINQTAGFLTQGQGEQGMLQNQYLTALSAAQTQLNNAMQSQAQGIGALESAQGAVMPQQVSPTNVPYNPATNTYGTPAASGYGVNGLNGVYSMLGSAQAAQNNAQTAGTAGVTANQGVYNTALSSLANYQTMAANIKSFGDQAIQNISTLPLTSSQLANTTINQASSQFNSPQFAQFNANIQGLQARVSALLGTGEIPSSATAGAQAIVNGSLNLGSLQATMNQINNEASAIVSNQADTAQKAYQNIQSGTGSQTSSGSTVSAGGYNYVLQNGKWVVA